MREEKASALPLLLDVRRMDENNRAYAYRMLRKNIMTLQLQPGCQLSEAELCEQLAMSRTPVHEALMMLKSEWLVDVLPQRGSIVSKISVPYLNEGFAMRRILEPALLRGLAGKLTREQLNEFQELLNRQNEDLYLDQDAADDFFISLDNDFHRLLYHDSGYDRIWEAMHNVTSHMDRVRYQVPGLRLRQCGRHRDDRSGPAAFQCVHQTCDFVSAYGREEVNSYFCKCGLRRGHSSGKPGSLQA